MSPVRIPENVGDFRLVDRRAEVLRQLPERNRFKKGLFAWGLQFRQRALRAAAARRGIEQVQPVAAVELRLDGLVSFRRRRCAPGSMSAR
jgi:hypothetical protein